jgi:nucleotidyltransferase substrate binding protein (TIGR01987 family)
VPRGCIKEEATTGMVTDGDAWIGMLEARNRTAHLYDRDDALAVYRAIKATIKATYIPLLQDLEETARRSLRD